jgi:hypothetical protein
LPQPAEDSLQRARTGLLLSEPFLAQESQKVEFPFRLRLPMMGAATPAGMAQANVSSMNLTLLMLVLFLSCRR